MQHQATDATEATRALLERRMEVVTAMFAGQASYDDVLDFHADDFVWLSAAGAQVGKEQAAAHHAARMERVPPAALAGVRVLRRQFAGEYGFTMFKTDTVPFGTDSYRVVDGKVVFQSNALYLPRR
jgi:hypothetical protein